MVKKNITKANMTSVLQLDQYEILYSIITTLKVHFWKQLTYFIQNLDKGVETKINVLALVFLYHYDDSIMNGIH